MKIILACEIYPPETGGPASFVKRILPFLKESDFEAKVITYADQNSKETDLIKIKRVSNLLFRYWHYFSALWMLSKEADLIFAQGPTAAGLPAILVKKFSRLAFAPSKRVNKKVIIKVVGDVAWERSFNNGRVKEEINDFQNKKYGFAVEMQKFLRSWTVKRADLVITPSQYLKGIVAGWGVCPEKIQVIYNSSEAQVQALAKNEAKQKLNLDGFIIFSSGRLTPWKGFAGLINLMPRFLALKPDCKLLIAGSGPDEQNLKIKVKNLKLEDKVIFAGQVAQADMPAYYSAADLFILNSGYEGLSHALLEALSYNLPTIASNIGGNSEVIHDNVNGLLFAYNNQDQIFDSVEQIFNNPQLVEKFNQESQKVLQGFGFQRMINEYFTAFKNV